MCTTEVAHIAKRNSDCCKINLNIIKEGDCIAIQSEYGKNDIQLELQEGLLYVFKICLL